MDGVQLSQGYGATTRTQFTFYHSIPRFRGVPGTELIELRRMEGPPSGFEDKILGI